MTPTPEQVHPDGGPNHGPLVHGLHVLAGQYPDATVAELTGLLVAQTLGAVYAERDQARAIAEDLARKLSEALTHLDQVVTYAEGTAPTFAKDGDMVKEARAWLDIVKADHAVASPQTPEQETT